ncbi:DoxX family protein [Chitinophaga solisilvae]|uniref:DoxX family protein n=1 Tax=Chitinophaga solisilvae TaxID=1233460 RepID=A0A433WBX9_9BACT|nr:DoxX family protein [Chitinophaga solisilvae]NSL87923.1 DoxX family protein [Chitinophaga solisilvae]
MRKLFSTGYTNGAVSFSMLVLRLVFGGLILLHGWPKLIHFAEKMNSFADPLGVGHKVSLGMTVFAEVFCAVLVMAGLLTRLAAIPLIICMSVILLKIHNHDLMTMNFDKIELPIMYLGAFLAIAFTGPGKISIDGALGK